MDEVKEISTDKMAMELGVDKKILDDLVAVIVKNPKQKVRLVSIINAKPTIIHKVVITTEGD